MKDLQLNTSMVDICPEVERCEVMNGVWSHLINGMEMEQIWTVNDESVVFIRAVDEIGSFSTQFSALKIVCSCLKE